MTTEAKIGIGIVHCQSTPGSTDIGFTPVYKSDYGKWSSIIDDTGAVFRHVKIDYETILRMIHFSKDGEGWYMCSMKPIPGRDEEYRASWVYFPSTLDLSQKDIKNVIEVAESQIKQKEFDSNKLQEVIHSYTQCNDVSPRYNVPTIQRGFAFRDTSGDINLFDLYGCMYQKEFTEYEWVILMDKSLLMFKGEGVEDISNRKILESQIINPTSNEFGFVPYHNDVVFQSPVRIMDGAPLSIVFKKKGYLDIQKTIKTQSDFSISINDCKKYFKKSQFVATDAKNKNKISNAIIKPLNASEDKTRTYWIFAEQNLEIAKFNVMAEGYTADSFILDLRDKSLNDELHMDLEPEAHEYLFILPLDRSVVKDCDSIEVCVHSQFLIKESPFKGYRCSGTPREGGITNRLSVIQNSSVASLTNNVNHSRGYTSGSYRAGYNHTGQDTYIERGYSEHPDDNNKKKWKYIKNAFWCILILAVVVVLGYWVKEEFFKNNTYTGDSVTVGCYGGDSSDNSDDQWSTAYGYLKEHTNQIRKNDMECFDDLKGLYDIVNGYRFKDYVDYIDNHPCRDDILSIDEWKRLYDKAKEIDSNKKGVYNTEDADQSITFENYFKKDFSKLDNTDSNHVNAQERQQGGHNNGPQGGHNNGPQGGHNNGPQGGHNNGQQGVHNSGNQQTSNQQGDNI